MATQDDDTLTGVVPGPEIEPSASERAHARRFAELVDKTLTGRTPPAVSVDDRALLEVATVIRATHGSVELAPSTARIVVEDALRMAIGEAPANRRAAAAPVERAKRAWTWAPWAVAATSAAVAAAAVAALWLRAPHAPAAASAPVPVEWTSRTADPLVGPITRERAGDASARIDAIFADRLDGFRARTLRGSKR